MICTKASRCGLVFFLAPTILPKYVKILPGFALDDGHREGDCFTHSLVLKLLRSVLNSAVGNYFCLLAQADDDPSGLRDKYAIAWLPILPNKHSIHDMSSTTKQCDVLFFFVTAVICCSSSS